VGAQRRRALGATGEDRAANWYLEHGYEVLDRNWRCRDGELDLVLRLGRTVVFCEVKTRSGGSFGQPAEAVGAVKQARIRRLAARWLADHRTQLGARPAVLRFDVVAILGSRLEILEAAF
jgi:putative endonuclease